MKNPISVQLFFWSSCLLLLSQTSLRAQTTTGWTGTSSGYWNNAGNWTNGIPGGTGAQGSIRILNFGPGGNARPNSTNDIGALHGHRIFFNTGATNYTLSLSNGVTGYGLFDFSSVVPKLENDSANLQTINLPFDLSGVNAGNGGEINPVSASLLFTTNAAVNLVGGTQLRIFGSQTVTFNAAITGTNSAVVETGATVVFAATNTLTNVYILSGTVRLATSAVNTNPITLGDTTGTLNSALQNDNGLTNSNPLVARFGSTGSRTIGNSTVGTGPSLLSGAVSLGTNLITLANTNGTLTFTGDVDFQNSTGTNARTLTVSGAGDTTFSGSLTNASTGISALFKTNAGTLTLIGTNNGSRILFNHGGGVISITNASAIGIPVNANYPDKFSFTTNATLRVTNSFTLGSNVGPTNNGGFRIAGGATGIFDVATNSTLSIDGVIIDIPSSGSGNLTKAGAGTLVLKQTNSYSGTNTVSAGSLKISNVAGSATGTGPVAVNAAGTLTGAGAISGAVTLDGTISPGSGGPGTITTGAETWDNGAHYLWEINSTTGSAGADPGWDLITVNGSLNIAASAGGFNIDITGLNTNDLSGAVNGFVNSANYSWTILHTTGGISGFNAAAFTLNTANFTANNPLGSGVFQIVLTNSGNDLALIYVTTPSITTAPTNLTVIYGGTAVFNVSAGGTAPLSYQWRKGGSPISGATTSAYSFGSVHMTDAGNFDVVVTNNYGSITSAVAVLTVNKATLTVKAVNQTRVYGAPNPTLTFTYTNFVNGESLATSDVTGSPSITTTATTNSTVAGSPYPITVANGSLSSGNYAFSFTAGSLAVTTASSSLAIASSTNPSPTGSNVTLTATLSGVAPSTGKPTGTVQFLTNGTALGSPVTLASGVATVTTGALPHGTNIVTAQYAGDGNFTGSTNSLNQVINTAPVAGTANYSRPRDVALHIKVSGLLTNATDADGDVLSLLSVSATSTNGATLFLTNGFVAYTPPVTNGNVTDSFNYTVQDSFGATNLGTVVVSILPDDNGPSVNITSMTTLPNGTVQLGFAGIPNYNYLIQATTNMTPTIIWTTLTNVTAGTNGQFQYIDLGATNFSTRFYRTAKP